MSNCEIWNVWQENEVTGRIVAAFFTQEQALEYVKHHIKCRIEVEIIDLSEEY